MNLKSKIKNDLEQVKQLIDNLDLSSVIARLVEIEKWSQKDAVLAIQQYRNYLLLKKKYPEYNLPPSKDIDDVWHAHILHTKEYRTFCKQAFSHEDDQYLDHDPHLAREGTMEQLAQLFEKTQMLYYQEFGEYIFPIREGSGFTRFLDKLRDNLITRFPRLNQLVDKP